MLLLITAQYTQANCPANAAPTNPQASSVCKTGYSVFTASINDLSNTLVWLDSANRIVGTGNNFQKLINQANLNFKVAEVGYDGISTSVGPLPSNFTSTYPSQNFTNGQYFTCATTIRIDSMVLRSNNAVNGNIQIWSKAPENGGYVLQKIPFSITTSGPANTRVPVGAILSTGNYFMNVEITSGNGILYRAIDGATYPYSVSNLISITGTNFVGDADRYYYFFDWKVSKMCMSPMSATITPAIIPTIPNIIPYRENFNNGIKCDWINSAPSTNAKWIVGSYTDLTNPEFVIPAVDTSILFSSDITCQCDKSSVKLESPWFDLRDYSKQTSIILEFKYLYKEKNNSKVYIHVRNANNTITKTDSLSQNLGTFKLQIIDLRDFILSDSVQFIIEHRDNGGDSSAVAITEFYISEFCSVGTYVNLEVNFDMYASEISWEIREAQTNKLIVNSVPKEDVNPYNPTNAIYQNAYCLIDGKDYIFKIKDSFGDGLDDGTHIGNYALIGVCNDTILYGSGALPYGGQVLPELAWDSVIFTAGVPRKINLGADVVLNYEDTLILDAGPKMRSYYWNTGDTTRFISIPARKYIPGNYQITVQATPNYSLCIARDTINLQILGNYAPLITVGVITDTKGNDIYWELRDKATDTLIATRGPFQNVIPYNINLATHIDTIRVEYAQELSFRITDMSGNGLNDGTIQGKAWVSNTCMPELFKNETVVFPYSEAFSKYDSIVFTSSARPQFDLGADISLCDGDSILLNSNSSSNEYLWNIGSSNTRSILVKSSDLNLGANNVIVSNYQGICYSVDTIKITKLIKPAATFTTTQNGGSITCMGMVTGQQAYHWDFGDGATSNTRTATHQYTANGNYTITYSITNANGCENTSSKIVSITGVGIDQIKATDVNIFPNPSEGEINILANNNLVKEVELIDMQGRILHSYTNDFKKDKLALNYKEVSSGMYFIKVKFENTEIIKKISIQK